MGSTILYLVNYLMGEKEVSVRPSLSFLTIIAMFYMTHLF